MKKIWTVLLLALFLTGCKVQQEIKLDTIVDIPLHPTEQAAETAPTREETTIPATEAGTEAETQSAEDQTENAGKAETGSGKSTGSSSGKGTGGKTEKPTAGKTEHPTAPPETQPPTERPTEAPTEPVTEATERYDINSFTPGALEYGIIAEINARRSEAELSQIASDTTLCRLAALRARELSINWSHSRPDGSDFRTVFGQYGYPCTGAAENIYFGVFGAGAIVDKWMSDEDYSEKLLLAATAIGAGSYSAENGLTYVVVLIVW